jgi:hypothetical protein
MRRQTSGRGLYSGYGKLYELGRSPGPILEAACWVRARRPFFVMADLAENARRKAQGQEAGGDLAAGAGGGRLSTDARVSPQPIRR